jgi:hypothetical protein
VLIMSLELVDFRTKISHETDAVLDMLQRTTGRDRSELAREVLHEWAMAKVHEANVLANLFAAKGLKGIAGGTSGQMRADEGSAGKRRAS